MKKRNIKKNKNCTCGTCVEASAPCVAKPVKKQNFGKASWKKLAEALADNVRLALLAGGIALGATTLTHALPELSAIQTNEVLAIESIDAQCAKSDAVEAKGESCHHTCAFQMHMAGQIEAARLAVSWMFGADQVE